MKYYAVSKISENIHETPEGYLICIGVPIARTGVQIYSEGETPLETVDGQIEIYRDEKDVFNPKTIASFEGKAITIRHPTDFVNPDNWAELTKGIIQNVRRGKEDQKDDLIADLLITDKMAIGLVKNGLREVSCGYEAEYIQNGKGKGTQKNIVGNHLALVDEGRAGPGYAINDHKGEKKMNLKERIKAIFAKAQDEAMQLASDEDKKDDKAKDEDDKDKKDDKSKDAGAYDELVKMVKDLGEKIAAMGKPKDEDDKDDKKSDDEDPDKKDDKKADDEEKSMEDRMKALELAVSKLLDGKSGDEDGDGDEDDKSEDDDFDESTLVGDSAEIASRAEILAPGLKMSKDIKVKALKTAYATKEGKKIIDGLTGGKLTFDSAEKVNTLFIAASEVIKAQRTDEFSKTKRTKDSSGNTDTDEGAMTAEKMNEINANFYKKV